MSFRLEGTYFENCNCEVICPCTWSGLSVPATQDRCNVVLVLHVDRGEIDGVDVSGLSFGFIADTPALMSEGNWRLAVLLDAAGTSEQVEKLTAFMSGEYGGVPAMLGPLIGEMLGVHVLPIEYRDDGRHHHLRIGDDAVVLDVEDVVSGGLTEPVQLVNVFHPVATTLTVSRGVDSSIALQGIEFSGAGKSGFSAPFNWAA